MRVGGQDHHHSNLQTCPYPLSNYTGEVYSPFKEAFEEFDEDNDGFVTIDDVGNMMKFLNLNPTDAELKIIMDEVDTNTDGKVDM